VAVHAVFPPPLHGRALQLTLKPPTLRARPPPIAQLRGGRTGVEGPGLSARQRVLFGLGTVALPYLWQRAHRLLSAHEEWGYAEGGRGGGAAGGAAAARPWAARAWRALRWLEGAYKVGVAANLVVFLYHGVYR
jgi:peroxin-2